VILVDSARRESANTVSMETAGTSLVTHTHTLQLERTSAAFTANYTLYTVHFKQGCVYELISNKIDMNMACILHTHTFSHTHTDQLLSISIAKENFFCSH